MLDRKKKLIKDVKSYQLGRRLRERLKREKKMTPEEKTKLKALVEDIELNFSPYLDGR